MNSQGKFLVISIILAIALSACGPDGMGMDGLEELAEEVAVPDPDEADRAGTAEGEANVFYHYRMMQELVNYEISANLPVKFYKNNDGNWVADATGGTEVELYMLAQGGPEVGYCSVMCNLTLNMVGDGKLAPIPDNMCSLAMTFSFKPGEDWFIETDCPDDVSEKLDCAALSNVMRDPSVYTFTPMDSYDRVIETNYVLQEAEFTVQTMPAAIRNECGW